MTKKNISVNTHTDKLSTPILKKIEESDCQNTKSEIAFLLFKQEQILETWLTSDTCKRLIAINPIQLSSAQIGPRLYDWEARLPEGIYQFQLHEDTISINYPNAFDSLKAIADNRPLMTHSIVFQSIEQQNSIILSPKMLEELRVFLDSVDSEKIQLIIIPSDIREGGSFPYCSNCPHWVYELYGQLKQTINAYTL